MCMLHLNYPRYFTEFKNYETYKLRLFQTKGQGCCGIQKIISYSIPGMNAYELNIIIILSHFILPI